MERLIFPSGLMIVVQRIAELFDMVKTLFEF